MTHLQMLQEITQSEPGLSNLQVKEKLAERGIEKSLEWIHKRRPDKKKDITGEQLIALSKLVTRLGGVEEVTKYWGQFK